MICIYKDLKFKVYMIETTNEVLMKYIRQFREITHEYQNFTLFWIGQSLSEIGTRLTGFGLSIWVYQSTQAVTQLSLVLFFTIIPGVLITPFVGVFIDKWNRKLTIIFTEIAATLITLFLALLLITDNLQIWHMYVSAFLISICGCFQFIGKGAFIPMIVGSDQIGRANGLLQFSSSIAQLTTPIIAGVIIAHWQFQNLLIIDIFTYLIGIFTILLIDATPPEVSVESSMTTIGVINDIVYGWEKISAHSFTIFLMGFTTINFFVNGMTSVLVNPLILSFSNTEALGSIMSIGGLGTAAGSIFMSIWGGGKKSIPSLFIFCCLNGIGLIIAGIKPSILIIACGIFLSFFTLPIVLSIINQTLQTTFHLNVQGRVFSLFYMVTGLGYAFGNLSASPLTDQILEPALSFDGILASTIGKLIGTGQGRGIGFLMIIQGLIIFIISISFYSYFHYKPIDEEQKC